MKRNQSRRAGYTLLEVTLALAIAVLLLAAVYTALYTTVMQTKIGRDMVEDTNVARSVVNRINEDISAHLKPIDTRLIRTPQTWTPQALTTPAAPATDSGQQAAPT